MGLRVLRSPSARDSLLLLPSASIARFALPRSHRLRGSFFSRDFPRFLSRYPVGGERGHLRDLRSKNVLLLRTAFTAVTRSRLASDFSTYPRLPRPALTNQRSTRAWSESKSSRALILDHLPPLPVHFNRHADVQHGDIGFNFPGLSRRHSRPSHASGNLPPRCASSSERSPCAQFRGHPR